MGYNEWSDEESSSRNHGRDKFRHERSVERDSRAYGNDEYERYDRKKRGRRSPTPPEGIILQHYLYFYFIFILQSYSFFYYYYYYYYSIYTFYFKKTKKNADIKEDLHFHLHP